MIKKVLKSVPALLVVLFLWQASAPSGAMAADEPAVLFVGGVHPEYVAQPLVEMGIEVDEVPVGKLARKLNTGRYNVVVAGKLPEKARKRVQKFCSRGGGALLLYPQSPHRHTDRWTNTQQWHRKLGATPALVVLEETDEKKTVTDKMRQTLAWSDSISGPVAEGVKGVLTLSGKQSHAMGWPISYRFTDDWQVVVRGSETMKGNPATRTDRSYYKPWLPPEPIESSPPLMGTRQYQTGRLAIVGINRKWLFSPPRNCPTCENMLSSGAGEYESSWLRVFANAFRWLSEPSLKKGRGGFKTPQEVLNPAPKVWKPRSFRNTSGRLTLKNERQTNGLIGARTKLSSGSGTVKDYVKAAKAADLDFIVFLEKFPEIGSEGWQKLEKQCEKFTSEGFAAIPGLTYQDAQGNHLFAFSDRVSPPKTEWLTEDGKRLATTKKYRTRNYFNYINEHLQQKVISGFWRHDDNFLHQADYKLYNGFPVKSFVDGKPVDDAVEEYQYWMVNGGAQAALAFEIMTTPDMVTRRARKGWQVISNRKPVTLRKRWHRGALSFSGDGDQYITNGPRILTWRRSSNMGMHGQWYRPDLAQYEISLKVASDAGLRTVTLYNGRRVLRRWKPDGRTFEHRMTIANQQQRALYLIVEDQANRRAIGEEYYVRNLLSNQFYCSDRCNFLGSARLRRKNGAGKWVENGFNPNAGITPNKSQVETDYRPAIQLNRSNPTLPIDGKPKGLPGPRLHFNLHNHVPGEHAHLFSYPLNYLIGPNINAGQAIFRYAYDPEASQKRETPLGYPYEKDQPSRGNAWSSWHNLVPTNVLSGWTRIYATIPLLGDHVFRVGWHRTHAVMKRTVELTGKQDGDDGPARIQTMRTTGGWRIYRDGKKIAGPQIQKDKPRTFQGKFGRGTYAIKQTPNGDAILVGRGDKLSYRYRPDRSLRLYHETGTARLDKGTTVDTMVPFVGAAAAEKREDLRKFAQDFGIARPGSVGYKASVSRGRELDNYLFWRLQSSEGAVEAETEKTALGAYLTTIISGLNDNWSVHLLDRKMPWPNHRALPIRDGKAYALLDLSGRERDLFIGHPVVASNDKLRLAVYWHSPGTWYIEAHNPSDQTVDASLRTNDGWDRFEFQKKVALEPGTSQSFYVQTTSEESGTMIPTSQKEILTHRGWMLDGGESRSRGAK